MNLKDAAARIVTGAHRAVFDVTRGRVAGRAGGMPVVKLTTIGRKSGQPRDTMLTSPVHGDGRVVLVASYDGDDRDPSWYRNLRAEPNVTVTMDGRRRRMVARTAGAEEKAALWSAIVAGYPRYAGYQRRTDRDIPVVILEPAPDPAVGRPDRRQQS